MVSKKKISNKKFILIIGIIFLLLFIFLMDSHNSSMKERKVVLNNISTNAIFADIGQYIFDSHLMKKDKAFDEFSDKFLNFNCGGIIKNFENWIDDISSGASGIINNAKIRNFRNNFMKLNPNIDKPLFGVTTMHSVFKLKKNCENLPEPEKEIVDYSCKGEWESVQIIVVPFKDTLKNIDVKITGLPFSAMYLQCFSGEYAFCNASNYPADSGWIADPLIPMDIDTSAGNIHFKYSIIPSEIPIGETRSIWLNYFIPSNTKSGEHNINVAVKATSGNKSEEHDVKIKLNVFDYTLPKSMHLKTAFSFAESSLMNYYKVYDIPENLQKEYYSFFLNYHLNPVSLYNSFDNTFPAIEDWQWCIDRGANYFNLGYLDFIHPDSIKQRNVLASTIAKKIDYLKQNKLMDYAYIYGFDEIDKSKYYTLESMCDQLRKINRDIPFVCSVSPSKELSGYVNTWVPKFEYFDENIKKINQNEKMWEYICCTNRKYYPNFFIEYPAIDSRIVFWQCSKYNIDGFLYYCVNNWDYNCDSKGLTVADNPYINKIKNGARWPDIPWIGHSFRWHEGQRYYNGDGQLIYPGKNMKLYPSVRLVNIREGIEDYECFYQLKLLKKKFDDNGNTNKSSIIEKFIKKVYEWSSSYNDYETYPEKIFLLKKEACFLLESSNH